MGSGSSLPKRGELYNRIRNDLKPFDLLLFRGGDFISSLIRSLQKYDINKDYGIADNFSHVGMVVTSDILDYQPYVKPGKIYILECAMSGKLGQGVKSVEGDSRLGIFLRDFDDLVYKYDTSDKTRVAVAPLKENPWEKATIKQRKELKRKFTRYFHSVNGGRYDLNPVNLLSVISSPFTKIVRMINKPIGKVTDTDEWLICSALVAKTYIEFGILPDSVEPKHTYPVDFLGIDDDDMPLVVQLPPTYITTPKHFVKGYSDQEPSENAEYAEVIAMDAVDE